MKQLYALGARRFGVLSTVAFGCEPSARFTGGSSCSMVANLGAQMYNNLLKEGIASLQSKHPDAKLVFFDIFTPLVNIASNPQQFGKYYYYHFFFFFVLKNLVIFYLKLSFCYHPKRICLRKIL